MMSSPRYSPRHARKARRWVVRLASGECAVPELDQLQAWLAKDARHRAAFEQQRQIWKSLEPVRAEILSARPDLLRRRLPETARGRIWQPIFAATAMLLMLVWMGPGLWLDIRADHRSDIQPQTFVLTDGSTVSLDADSAISVDFTGNERRIDLLRGRAWFDVAADPARPFKVDALGGRTLDISTAFAVGLRNQEVRTAVSNGEVEVFAQLGAAGRRIKAGQSVTYRKGGQVTAPVSLSVETVGAWRNGEILLVGIDGRRAIKRIAMYRSAPVWVLGDVAGRGEITGSFRIDSADQAIRAVVEQLGLTLRHLPGDALLIYPAE